MSVVNCLLLMCHSGALVLLALAFLTPMFYYIPDTALAAVIIMAVTDMISFTMLKHLWTINSTSFTCCHRMQLILFFCSTRLLCCIILYTFLIH